MEAIHKILRTHRTDGIFHTHVSMCSMRGKYQFDRSSLEEFWNLYCDLQSNEKSNNNVCGVAEKPQHYLPVLVDVDIKIEKDDNNELKQIYTTDHIMNTIATYQSILRKILKNCDDKDLICVLLEKSPYLDKRREISYIKNGFHLHFPQIFLSKVDQEIHLLPRIRESLSRLKLFEDIGFSKDSYSTIIDKGYCKTPWLLYGSVKKENMKPYKFTNIFDANLDEISIEEAFINYKIFDENEQQIKFRKEISYYLPRILSIIPYGREISEIKSNLDIPFRAQIIKRKNKELQSNKLSVKEELKIAGRLIKMLSKHRAEDYSDWMIIGWALYNIGKGGSDSLNLWLEFSNMCPEKFSESKCVYEWNKMLEKDMTLGTLKHYASRDNPAEYKKFVNENMEKHIMTSLKGSHNDIAKALFEKYGTEFTCSSITYKTWFQFKNHVWSRIEEGFSLRKTISNEITYHYIQLIEKLNSKWSEANKNENEVEKKMIEEDLKACRKLINCLKSAPYKNNIMKESMEVFYDERFAKKLDKNPYLIGFQNGVYDLKRHEFRRGMPEDFISLKMAVDFDENMTEKDNAIHEVYDFLEKIFPDKSVREYFLDTASDVFIGGNPHKLVMVWSGEGDNGKSITESIFEKMLGEYAIKLPTSLITGKRTQSSAACPELARAGNGVRWAVLQEPDQKDVINIGILKELSGNDSFFARGLYKEGSEIQPMFKLVLICNDPPQLPYSDKATWNRIRVIPFESTFCDSAPDSFEEQLKDKKFPKDPYFQDKVPKLTKAFAWVLLDHMKKCIKRVEPEKVKLATADYRKKNDIYRQFVEESIMDDKNSKITLVELYTQFKEWFKDSLPNHSIPVKNEVKDYFFKMWGTPDSGIVWKGYRIRTLQDEIYDGDAVLLADNDLVDYRTGKPPI